MKITVIKTLGGLKPYSEKAEEVFARIKINDVIEIDYKKQRNSRLHRKYFKLIEIVFENQEHYKNSEDLRERLQIEAGYYRLVKNIVTGQDEKKALSIAYASMDDLQFSELYNKVLDTIIRVFGWSGEDIEENIASFI